MGLRRNRRGHPRHWRSMGGQGERGSGWRGPSRLSPSSPVRWWRFSVTGQLARSSRCVSRFCRLPVIPPCRSSRSPRTAGASCSCSRTTEGGTGSGSARSITWRCAGCRARKTRAGCSGRPTVGRLPSSRTAASRRPASKAGRSRPSARAVERSQAPGAAMARSSSRKTGEVPSLPSPRRGARRRSSRSPTRRAGTSLTPTRHSCRTDAISRSWPAKLDPEKTSVMLGSLDSKSVRRLFHADSAPVFADPGYLLFARDNALFAWRFDPGQARARRTARPRVPERPVRHRGQRPVCVGCR